MRCWVIVYVVAETCYVCTLRARSPMTDAATIQDEVADFLRAAGLRPESITVTGPYARVVTAGIPAGIGVGES